VPLEHGVVASHAVGAAGPPVLPGGAGLPGLLGATGHAVSGTLDVM